MLPERPDSPASGGEYLHIARANSLAEVNAREWDRLNASGCPFSSHAFLHALEQRQLVGAGTGWKPCHALIRCGSELVAAVPMYEKLNSFGEFVFDWVWADAYQRAGLGYYPKLVAAVPFTPVPGPRLLGQSLEQRERAARALSENAGMYDAYSSFHLLFPEPAELALHAKSGLLHRLDCRFHWHNQGFTDFDDFLRIFSARQRKNIRRERRKVTQAGIRFEWLQGEQMDAATWSEIHSICAATFLRRGQLPYLDCGFFENISRALPGSLLVNVAKAGRETVAAAIFFRDQQRLYGRYWGSVQRIDCLHFECCYYQGIEYAISNGLRVFDPGTQGEHKLRRGFAPVESWSLHKFTDERMGNAIAAWLKKETALVAEYIRSCRRNMPYQAPRTDGSDCL